MDNAQVTAPAEDIPGMAEYVAANVVPIAPVAFSAMSDRELLEHIASNMITPESLVSEMQRKLPEVLEALAPYADNPIVRAALRFLG